MVRRIKERGSIEDSLYCLLVFAVVTSAVILIRHIGLPFKSVLIPALWGLGAALPLRAGEGDLLAFGVTGSRFKVNLKYFLLSSLVIFSLYAIGFRFYVHWGFSLPVATPFEGVAAPNWLLYNFLAVALFEELFFRGYVQGCFERFANARFVGPVAAFWVPVLVSAFLFALAHAAVDLDPLRLGVFFPGLLFGWLRAKTGSLLAPILSHGSANVLSMLLISSVS